MKTHNTDRERPGAAGTHYRGRHGFTIIETVAALALFLGTITMLAAALSTAVASRELLRETREVDRMLGQLVDTAGTLSYQSVAANTFIPPQRCPGDTNLGERAKSCVSLLGRAYEIEWDVTEVAATGGASEGAPQLRITASTVDPRSGSTYSASQTVRAAASGVEAGSSAVRVRLQGDSAAAALFNRPLLLLGGDSFDQVIASATPDGSSGVVMQVPAGSCTSSPCRIGIRSGGLRGFDDTFMLDTDTVVGSNTVLLTDGAITDVVVGLTRYGTGAFEVEAVGTSTSSVGSGRRAAGPAGATIDTPQTGSVCVWVLFDNGLGNRLVPSCNTADNGRQIPLSTYLPGFDYVNNSGDSSTVMPIPLHEGVAVLSDPPGTDTCPSVAGQQTYSAGAWSTSTVGVCSSWTWGRPDTVETREGSLLAQVGDLNGNVVFPVGQHTVVDLVWAPAGDRYAAAATGVADGPIWSAPRDRTACPGFGVGACQPTWITDISGVGQNPEVAAACAADTLCLSSAPVVPAARSVGVGPGYINTYGWPYATVVAPILPTTFRTTFADMATQSAGAGFTVTVAGVPGSGALQICTPVCAAASVGTTVNLPASTGAIDWNYTPPPGGLAAAYVDGITFTVLQGGGRRTEVLPLVTTTGQASVPVALDAPMTVAPQDASASPSTYSDADVVAWGVAGTRMSGINLAVTGVTPLRTASNTVTTSAGVGAFRFNGTNVAATGAVPVPVTVQWEVAAGVYSPSVRTTARVAVTSKPGAFTALSAVSGRQGDTRPAAATVVDVAGQLMGGQVVSFSATYGGVQTDAITFDPPACVTSLTGTCQVTAVYAGDAPAGSWALIGRTGGVTAENATPVIVAIPKISSLALAVEQGTTSTLFVQLADGSGNPVGSTQVNLTAPAGVTITPNVITTNAGGTADTQIFVSGSVAPGTISVGAEVADQLELGITGLPVTVTAAPVNAEIFSPSGGNLVVTPDSSGAVDIIVEDATGGGVAKTTVTVETVAEASGVKVTRRGTTDTLGNLRINVVTGSGASGVATYRIMSGASQIGTFAVTVA